LACGRYRNSESAVRLVVDDRMVPVILGLGRDFRLAAVARPDPRRHVVPSTSAVECDTHLVRSWVRRASISGWATVVLATVAAVGAAVLVFLITRVATGEWRWLAFTEDVVRNVLIGGFVSASAVVINDSRRRHEEAQARVAQDERHRRRLLRLERTASLAASGWNQLPGEPLPDSRDPASIAETVDRYRQGAADLRKWAEEVEQVHDAPSSDTDAVIRARVVLSGLGSTIYIYIGEGMRERRFARLQHLADELADLEDAPDDDWSGPVAEFRRAVPAAVGWRSHTDATIVERLLVEQRISDTAIPFHEQSEGGRELRTRATLNPAASTFEPLYLLLVFLAATSDLTLEGSNEPRHAINRCLGALRNEMRMVADAFDAFIPVLELSVSERS
jgi:hypothetical protein